MKGIAEQMTTTRPLAGTMVVTLEQAVAAPLCSARLADAGARVIKIERTEGDFARGYDRVVRGQSTYFVWLNRGKESICLDIKDPADAALLRRMIARADVFIQNLAPGAAARAGPCRRRSAQAPPWSDHPRHHRLSGRSPTGQSQGL